VFWVPLAEAVAIAEEALLRAGFLLVASRAADATVEAELLDGRQQGRDLQPVAADLTRCRHRDAVRNRIFHFADDQFGPERPRAAIAEVVQLGEMVAGIDVEQGHRNLGRP